MKRYWALLAMIAPAAIGAASCALKDFQIEAGGTGGGKGSSTSASSSGAGGAGGSKCGVTYPDPPIKAVEGGMVDFVTALRTINFGDNGTVGLDLDHKCSCHGDGPSCQEPKMHCDDDQGRDNEASTLLKGISTIVGSGNFGSDFFSTKAYQGEWGLLFRVRGYNGEANDAQVEVDWYVSVGYALKGTGTPAWNGTDQWKISGSSVDNMDVDQPRYKDVNAYVTNSMLVASLPESEITVAGGLSTMTIHLTGAGLLAKIAQQPPAMDWQLTDGQIVGRWKISDAFQSVSSFRSDKGTPLCTTDLFYGTLKGYFCNAPDILASPGTPAKLCDAISFGIGFTADPAKLGAVSPPSSPSPGCPPASDPATDSCLQ